MNDTTKNEDNLQVKASFDNKAKLAIASTSVVDRQGEIIDQSGWNIKNFKKNPLLLWGHDHAIPAIGTAKNIKIVGEGKKAQLVFEPVFHEITDFAKAIKTMFDEGILNSFSVGFKPIEAEGNTYTSQELLEISAVNVPANPEARMMAMKSLQAAGFKDKTIGKLIKTDDLQDESNEIDETAKNLAAALERIETLEKDYETLVMAKGEQPQVTGRKAETEKRLNYAKVIAKAADKLLAKPSSSREVNAKVIKRAAEMLIVDHKKDLKE